MNALLEGELRVLPIGGLGEIGMNCMLMETKSAAIIIDCGLLFSELEHFGVEFLIPNFEVLDRVKDKLKAIILTHGHEDHIGALTFAIQYGINAPIYASPFTSLMVRERLKERGFLDRVDLCTFQLGDTIELPDFKIKTVSVNHSIVDACALIIETPAGRVIHTGDFKVDPSPLFGDVFAWNEFQKAGDLGVNLLLSDSTNVERHEHSLPESMIAQRFDEIFERSTGMILVTMFSSNVGRMGTILEKAHKLGKKVALAGRSVEQNLKLAIERGCVSVPSGLIIPMSEASKVQRNKLLVISSGCQGEPRAALNRIAHEEHPHLELGPDDTVLFSSKFIPGNEVAISKLVDELFRRGANVLYEAMHEIHTSGHATRPELKKVIETVRPKHFIPIHGEYRMLVLHAELAVETGVPGDCVHVVENGMSMKLSPDSLRYEEQIDDLRILVDGREGMEVSRAMLKERRKLAETGAVFVLVARERDQGRILTKPSVVLRGVIAESFEPWISEQAVKAAQNVVRQYHHDLKLGVYNRDLSEDLRLEVRRVFDRNYGKKPVVVPLIVDV